jgi:hypothetical protein
MVTDDGFGRAGATTSIDTQVMNKFFFLKKKKSEILKVCD